MNSPEVDRLVRSAARGDARAMDELLGQFRQMLCGTVAMRIDPRLSQRIDPSDVVQETLLTATKRLPDYQQRCPVPFFLWLRQMALERLILEHRKHLRADKRTLCKEVSAQMLSDESCFSIGEKLAAPNGSPSESAVRREDCQRLKDALEQLPPPEAELLVMKYAEQLSNANIAILINTSEAAVKMRHLRALRKLRAALRDASDPRDD